jgi:hypothetical protein
MWSKLSPSGYRHLTLISSTLKYKPWRHNGKSVEILVVTTWRSSVDHLLHTCHVYVYVRAKSSKSTCVTFCAVLKSADQFYKSKKKFNKIRKFCGIPYSSKNNPITRLDRSWGFQEIEALIFQENRQMKVVRLSALRTDRLYALGNIPGTHFC